jgi:GMP synthase (glutamine-hydrolysing)
MKSVLVLQHEPNVAMGSLSGVLAAVGLDVRRYDLFDSVPDDLPWNAAVGLIVLGGSMSANDGDCYPFLLKELDWLRTAVERKLPTLGICLGAQLLAKALGANVYRNAQPEIGWYEVELLPAAAADRLFCGRAARESVFQWHSDTFDLPPDAVQLAQSPLCGQQAFRFGARAYGLQYHVEMTPELLESWLREHEAGADSCSGAFGGVRSTVAPDTVHSKVAGRGAGGEVLCAVDSAAIRARAAKAFPAMDAFSQCVLVRFAAMCVDPAGSGK